MEMHKLLHAGGLLFRGRAYSVEGASSNNTSETREKPIYFLGSSNSPLLLVVVPDPHLNTTSVRQFQSSGVYQASVI